MRMQVKTFAFEVKAAADSGKTFEGMASVYHVLDGYNEIVAPGAFTRSLARFKEKGVIRYMHGTPVGRPTRALEMADGLMISGTVSDTAVGKDAQVLLKDKVIQSLSIGFSPVASMRLENEEAVKQYWQKAGYVPSAEEMRNARYGARVLTDIDLYEVSLVDIPANDACDITAVKSAMPGRFTAADLLTSARLDLAEIKAGRVLSKANWERLAAHEQTLRTCADDLKSFLKTHKIDVPEETGEDETNTDEDDASSASSSKSSTEVDVKALKAQLQLLSMSLNL